MLSRLQLLASPHCQPEAGSQASDWSVMSTAWLWLAALAGHCILSLTLALCELKTKLGWQNGMDLSLCFLVGNETPQSMADPWSTVPELRLNLCVYILCMVGGIMGNLAVILIMLRQKTSRKFHSDTWKTNLFLLSLSVLMLHYIQTVLMGILVISAGVRSAAGDGGCANPVTPVFLSPGQDFDLMCGVQREQAHSFLSDWWDWGILQDIGIFSVKTSTESRQ